jgi:hypothetical protein
MSTTPRHASHGPSTAWRFAFSVPGRQQSLSAARQEAALSHGLIAILISLLGIVLLVVAYHAEAADDPSSTMLGLVGFVCLIGVDISGINRGGLRKSPTNSHPARGHLVHGCCQG